MKFLPGAGQMKAADQYTIRELGIPSMELMERAAASCVRYMEEQKMDLSHICVVCGSGNNGGDGFAIARMLKLKEYNVTVIMAGNREHCSKECEEQIRLFENAGGNIGNEFEDKEYSIIVDAIFGVGLGRNIEGKYKQIIEAMNRSGARKFAVDIPSGISADTGNVLGTAFRADDTVTFQAEKFGMSIYPGKEFAGKVYVADIGISKETFEKDTSVVCEQNEADYRKLLPVRREDSNKGTYGKVLVIAGSRGMSGAAYLNAKSAYMAGAGLVQIYTPKENRVILQQLLPEAIITSYDSYDEQELLRLLTWGDVICIGSGIGTGEVSEKILKTTLKKGKVPCVVDADGLNLISAHKEYFEKILHKNYILTPHMKEMSRLTDTSVDDIKKERLSVLRDYIEKTKITCVLKDSKTVIGSYEKRPCLNISGNSAMAKAGSGDVLAGLITGILAQKKDCFEAAVLGTYIHGRAGDFARAEKGCYSVMAEDIIFHIGTVMSRLAQMEGETEDETVH